MMFIKDEKQISLSSRHVLVVEDNAAVADMLCWALEQAGYDISALVGDTTLAWLDSAMQSETPPALILLDLSIPSIHGASFLQHLRTRWKTAPPIIVLTTSKRVYEELAATERVLLKPFHVHDLLAEVQRVLPPCDRL